MMKVWPLLLSVFLVGSTVFAEGPGDDFRIPVELTPWQRMACAVGQRPFSSFYDTYLLNTRRLKHPFPALYGEVGEKVSRRHHTLCLEVDGPDSLARLFDEAGRVCRDACAEGARWPGYFRDVWLAYRRAARQRELESECKSICRLSDREQRERVARAGFLNAVDNYLSREGLVFNRYGQIVSPDRKPSPALNGSH